ncbi:TonB-dependent receptor [Brevundimonas denitrificans]|uniref:TonB-dependent receptor n=1 Tax=Brevundimonas denitrificans TaxID=1443434 RepID=A0ABQ6BN53_9CAUL|nr:TonB-dependent receptor [Brevundimonas denitrificans]GLS02716.1 TonB-dependent receptor [Brevundimonas denitrificans]
MTNRKRVFWATTALFSGLLVAGAASAQSSGTVATEATELDTVVVTGVRGPFTTDGTLVAETVAKTRSTITQEFIATQNPGQTILQTLNLVPGLNFVNADPYGNSGGNIRLRGFDGNRVSLTFDGVPLNDTGNYATYTNQQLDPELIERASVNTGTTDVDSPTASATGGTINYTTARPLEEAGMQFNGSIGEFNYLRGFVRADTGAFGPWGTTAYVAYSYTNYDKFKGPGELEKTQFNGKLYQDLGDGNFASVSAHWNVNRNDFYNNFITQAQFNSGTYLEQDQACFLPNGGAGAQNENTQANFVRSDGTTGTGSCTNYHGLRINPSNTGNIRGQFSYGLTDNIRFTFDPSFQYVIANGGNYSFAAERDNRFDQDGTNTTGVGFDLNGDGDVLDTIALYAPSNTNTHRYGIISSLIWDLNEDHRLRAAYTLDYGRHRQTGEATLFGRDAEPINVFGGQERWGSPDDRVFGRDGSFYRSRDRFSIAELQQFAIEYRGQFFQDAVTINIGARAPNFRRELNQYCYSLNGTSTVRCTTEATTPDLTRPGNVTFVGTTGSWIAPYQAELEYNDILPSGGVNWRFADGHSVYASYAEGISVPRTDNLYQPVRSTTGVLDFSAVQPETTKSYDLGYRFRNDMFLAQVALWYTEYENRIVSSRDNDPASPTFDLTIDRNVGAVIQSGLDAQFGWNVSDTLSVYGSASYNESELQDDLFLGNFTCTNATQVPGSTPPCGLAPGIVIPTFLQTAGKTLVETPDWTYSARIDWDATADLSLGLQAKYVGDRFASDVNDEVAPAYTVVDFDARYDLTNTFGIRDAYVQVNVTNLLEEDYLGNISTGNNSFAAPISTDPRVPLRSGQTRTYSIGAPRTAVISLGLKF